MKKLKDLFVILTLSLFMLVFCIGTFSVNAEETTTITVLTLPEGSIWGDPYINLKEEFEEAHPHIKVELITTGYNDLITKEASAFAAGRSIYDVVQIDYIFAPGHAKGGHLAPLNDLIDKEFLDKYKEMVIPKDNIDVYSYNGKLYGLATIGNAQQFIYNEKMLNEKGLDVPDTWDEFLEVARAVKNSENNQYGFVAGLERNVKAFSSFLSIFLANGGELFDSEWHPTVNTPAGIESLKMLKDLVETGPPGGTSYTEEDEVRAMTTEIAALSPFAWIPDAIKNTDGDYIKSTLQPKGEERNAPLMGGLGLAVTSYSEHKKEAAEFVRWFNEPEVQKNRIVQAGGQPCLKAAWEANLDAKPWFPSLMTNLENSIARPPIPEYSQIDEVMSIQISEAILGNITPEEALENGEKEMYEVMENAGYYK